MQGMEMLSQKQKRPLFQAAFSSLRSSLSLVPGTGVEPVQPLLATGF